ncbi:MAG: NusG domain II-containing protein [Lachnospiraceae bacterium]|nr:NusG domain II-containing protein [Lachnospiraceae bacterium]
MISIAVWLGVRLYSNITTKDGAVAVVYINSEKVAEYSLGKNASYTFESYNGGSNVLVIEDGYVYVSDASCPDRICVHHRKINKNGQSIVCLPNRFVVKIENGKEAELDGVTK